MENGVKPMDTSTYRLGGTRRDLQPTTRKQEACTDRRVRQAIKHAEDTGDATRPNEQTGGGKVAEE